MDIYARIAHLALIPPIMDLKDPVFISMGCLLGQSPWPVNRSTSLGEGRGRNSRSPLSSVPVTQLVRQPPFTTEACSQNPSLGGVPGSGEQRGWGRGWQREPWRPGPVRERVEPLLGSSPGGSAEGQSLWVPWGTCGGSPLAHSWVTTTGMNMVEPL